MPTIGSQYFQTPEETEEERRQREEQERLVAQAASQAAAQQQQAEALQQQGNTTTSGTPVVSENQNGVPAAATPVTPQQTATAGSDNNGGGGDGVEVDNTVSTVISQQNAATEQAMQDAMSAGKTNNQNYQNFIANLVQGYKDDLDRTKKEAELQKQIDTNKSVFAGVTEFVSGLANLIGTTQGAVNQQPRTYAQDWMREADQHRQQERDRLDRMRDRVRQQEMAGENARYQTTKEQIAEQLKLQQLKSANAITLAQQQKAEKDEAEQRKMQQKQMDESIRQFNETMGERIRARQADDAMQREQMEYRWKTSGFKKNDKGEWVIDAEAIKAQAGLSNSSSGRKSSVVRLSIPPIGSEQAETHYVNMDEVERMVYDYVNSGAVEDDLDEEGKKILENINRSEFGSNTTPDNMAKKLMPLIAHSPMMREMVRELAVETGQEQENLPAGDVDEYGFPNP